MEVIAFWTGVVLVIVYFRLTTRVQRRRWIWDFWGCVFVIGAAGALWTALQ